MKATSTHHPHASPHLPHTKAQQVLCNSCPSSQRPIIPEFSVCRKLARAHHSLETLPSQVSVPHSILWELWYFPRAALCLCEVSAFELFLHLPARGAKDTFPLGAPGCKIYSLGLSGIFFLIWQPSPLTPQVLCCHRSPQGQACWDASLDTQYGETLVR